MQLFIGFISAVLVSILAYRGRALSRSGALAATILGTIIFGLGGISWAILLLTFFISSSLLSRLFHLQKTSLGEKFSKGSQRDYGQVLANGGIAGLLVLLHLFFPLSDGVWVAYSASLAAVNADTWATELGVLNHTPPRLITSFRQVERGTSGGISWMGTTASLFGAILVGFLAVIFWQGNNPITPGQASIYIILISLAGFMGSLIDSLLGATLQSIYYCPVCQVETEHNPYHTCGSLTTHKHGLKFLDNDGVNIICALTAALLGFVVSLFIP